MHLLDQEGVITALSQLDLQIVQLGGTSCRRTEPLQKHALVSLVDGLINGLLNGGHLNVNDGLLERGNLLFDVFLLSPEDVWF